MDLIVTELGNQQIRYFICQWIGQFPDLGTYRPDLTITSREHVEGNPLLDILGPTLTLMQSKYSN